MPKYSSFYQRSQTPLKQTATRDAREVLGLARNMKICIFYKKSNAHQHFSSHSSAQTRTFETNLKNILQNDVQQFPKIQGKRKINPHFRNKAATEPPTFKRQNHPEFLIFQNSMPCL